MKNVKKVKQIVISGVFIVATFVSPVLHMSSVFAAPSSGNSGSASSSPTTPGGSPTVQLPSCDSQTVDPDSRCEVVSKCNVKDGAAINSSNCEIIKFVLNIINALSAMVVLVVIVSIIIAGIQYSASGNNPQITAAARKRIVNALLALVAYAFMYAFLQWAVPGGVL